MPVASYFTHILPDLAKELQPIQMSSPGACMVVSSRSTVFELSAMKYWVVSSMTLLRLACAGLNGCVSACCSSPQHGSLRAGSPHHQLAEGREGRVGTCYLVGDGLGVCATL